MADMRRLQEKEFYHLALEAYLAARLLIASTTFGVQGLYMSHLALETLLKSGIAKYGGVAQKKHDLRILNEVLFNLARSKELTNDWYIKILDYINPYQELGRYRALARKEFDPLRVDTPQIIVRGSVAIRPLKDIQNLDRSFMLLRGLIKDKDHRDMLDDLFLKNSTSEIIKSWNLPIDVQSLLISQNDYYALTSLTSRRSAYTPYNPKKPKTS